METLVALHGFAGTGRGWDDVFTALGAQTYRPVAPDLPGHGAAHAQRPVDWDTCVATVLAQAPPRFALAGYSMGGRIALRVALAAPERVTALGLVATTAGIDDPAERAARRASDAELADWLETRDIAAFADRWCGQPLFAADPAQVVARAREDILRNDSRALAAALRGLGTGTMAPLWDRLGELAMPTAIVVGARDAKFRALGDRLAAGLPDATLTVIPGAGHGLPREAPDAVAAALVALAEGRSAPRLLAGGNPQIAKADGDAPVQEYIAAMPGWKHDVGRDLDALIVEAVPEARKAVRWNSPLYGTEGDGWFLSVHCFTRYVRVTFFRGTSLRPVPPGASKQEDVRYLDIHEDDDLDRAGFVDWVRQASRLRGWDGT